MRKKSIRGTELTRKSKKERMNERKEGRNKQTNRKRKKL